MNLALCLIWIAQLMLGYDENPSVPHPQPWNSYGELGDVSRLRKVSAR